MNARKLVGTICIFLAAWPVLLASEALCEDEYKTPALEGSIPWMAILYALVCLLAVSISAFKHARRTHLG